MATYTERVNETPAWERVIVVNAFKISYGPYLMATMNVRGWRKNLDFSDQPEFFTEWHTEDGQTNRPAVISYVGSHLLSIQPVLIGEGDYRLVTEGQLTPLLGQNVNVSAGDLHIVGRLSQDEKTSEFIVHVKGQNSTFATRRFRPTDILIVDGKDLVIIGR